jgi:rhamnulokinase
VSTRYLGIDLGADSGRVILGTLTDEGVLTLGEPHRFRNGMVDFGGTLVWDAPGLYRGIVDGLAAAGRDAQGPVRGIGVDSWGVDFGLLDAKGRLLGLPIAYRDRRTEGIVDRLTEDPGAAWLFEQTGTRLWPFNTICQLCALALQDRDLLALSRDLLFTPDLYGYLLSGEKASEMTMATTSGLYRPATRTWHDELFERLELPRELMQPLVDAGTVLGPLRPGVVEHTGLSDARVFATATHDTASAVAAVPATSQNAAFISCGTWSIAGFEAPEPVTSRTALEAGFSNEGGVGGTARVLKNIMGLWLLQECRRVWARAREISWQELVDLSRSAPPLGAVLDVASLEFLNPDDMPSAIAGFLRRTGQPEPRGRGGLARLVLESLALEYRYTVNQIAGVRGSEVSEIHLVGGGSRNELLCQMTADACGLPVLAGPAEATAVGNLLVQAMADGQIPSLTELRAIVRRSLPPRVYEPEPTDRWDDAYTRLIAVKQVA